MAKRNASGEISSDSPNPKPTDGSQSQGLDTSRITQFDPKAPRGRPTVAVAKAVATADTHLPHPDLYKARDELIERLGLSPGKRNVAQSQGSAFRRAQITGVGVGSRFSQKSLTGQLVVKVFVSEKLRESSLHPDDLIPKTINGFPTDVEEYVPGRPHAADAQFPLPVRCGVAVGLSGASEIGTIAAVVLLTNGNLCILSNNHILANMSGDRNPNASKIGQLVLQPGTQFGSTIGALDDFVPYTSTGPNLVDAAVALTSLQNVSPAHVTYELNPQPIEPTVHLTVLINGMMSGASIGMVTDVGVNGVPVNYPVQGQVIFDDQIFIRGVGSAPFSNPGDSGSLVVTAGSNQPVALLIGGMDGPNGMITVASPISRVIEALNIARFISPSDVSNLTPTPGS